MLGEFLSANVSAPFLLFMVEGTQIIVCIFCLLLTVSCRCQALDSSMTSRK